jgi:hypothetical protein
MLPGLTERERRAADLQRLAWLHESMVGPMRAAWAPERSLTAPRTRTVLPIGLWRRGLASARVNGRRLRLLQPGSAAAVPSLAVAD